jgi:hypothetical protein
MRCKILLAATNHVSLPNPRTRLSSKDFFFRLFEVELIPAVEGFGELTAVSAALLIAAETNRSLESG